MAALMSYPPARRMPLSAPVAPGHSPQASVLMLDEPIELPQPPAAQGCRPALLGQLLEARSAPDRRRAVMSMLHGLGFDWLGYGRMRQVGSQAEPLSFCTAYANEQWTHRYFQQRYHQVDPRLPQALQSALPFVWTVEMLREQAEHAGTTGRQQRFLDELKATGMRSGVMLALPGPGQDRGYVSFLSGAQDAQWVDDAVLGRVITFAMCLHEFYSRWLPLPAPMEPAQAQAQAGDLSPLQVEILSLLAQGLADKQIADRLNLSLHNVDYHLRRLRRRFGVRNRVQLMQAAAR